MNKREFRLAALERRDSLTVEKRRDYSGRIVQSLTGQPCYQEAEAILSYISFRSEVDTIPLLKQAFADGKAVFAPKVMGKEMFFFRIFSFTDLAEGYRGIREPLGGQQFDEWKIDRISQKRGRGQKISVLICMPGAVFDLARHRIGYGGGFYDRYLSGLLKNGEDTETTVCPQMRFTTAALAFSCQIVEEIPFEVHDICPQRIVTETMVI